MMLQVPGGASYLYCYWKGPEDDSDKVDARTIIYGLSESGRPPTLIFPRTNGVIDDNDMNRTLARHSAADVFAAIFDRTIILASE